MRASPHGPCRKVPVSSTTNGIEGGDELYSTIIELSSSPVAESEWVCSDELPEWFYGDIADYIGDADDRMLSLQCLARDMDGFADFDLEQNCLTLKADAKEKYFQGAYRKYKETLEKLAQVPLEEFSGISMAPPSSGSLSALMYSLRSTIEDRFGTYIYADGELTTLDEWLRYASAGDVYYIGGVMNYHF